MITAIEPFYRGDTVEWKLMFKTEVGAAVDITGWKIYLTLKTNRAVGDRGSAMQLRFTTPPGADTTSGIFYLQISNELTETLTERRYFADLQIIKPDGVVTTFELGNIVVKKDITRNIG